MARRQSDHETSHLILQAALEEFARRGFDGTRMQTIADRAGVNKALLFYYFRSKEKLFRNCIKTEARELIEVIRTAGLSADEVPDFISAIVDEYFTFIEARPGFVKLMVAELMGDNPIVQELLHERMADTGKHPLADIEAKINAFQQAGKIRGDTTPLHIFATIMGNCAVTFVQHLAFGSMVRLFESHRDFISERRQLIKSVLTAGLQPASPQPEINH